MTCYLRSLRVKQSAGCPPGFDVSSRAVTALESTSVHVRDASSSYDGLSSQDVRRWRGRRCTEEKHLPASESGGQHDV